MRDHTALTVRAARDEFLTASKLAVDGGATAHRWEMIRIGPMRISLKNFAWRRRAVPHHDLHHLATGYACSPRGEFEMAAWEFAAGRFPNAYATLFCLPLLSLGLLAAPRRTFAAFMRGRRNTSLYSTPIDSLLDLPLAKLQAKIDLDRRTDHGLSDVAAFVLWTGLSMLLSLGPFALAAAVWWIAAA